MPRPNNGWLEDYANNTPGTWGGQLRHDERRQEADLARLKQQLDRANRATAARKQREREEKRLREQEASRKRAEKKRIAQEKAEARRRALKQPKSTKSAAAASPAPAKPGSTPKPSSIARRAPQAKPAAPQASPNGEFDFRDVCTLLGGVAGVGAAAPLFHRFGFVDNDVLYLRRSGSFTDYGVNLLANAIELMRSITTSPSFWTFFWLAAVAAGSGYVGRKLAKPVGVAVLGWIGLHLLAFLRSL